MLLINALIYILSFLAIWIGSGLIVSSITKLSHNLKVPSFLISFVILGLLTSTPELAVGLTSVSSNNPSIFVGNLLGGVPILFLFVIPTLAILGRGIKLQALLSRETIPISLAVSILPFIVVIDGKVSNPEGVTLIIAYLAAVVFLQLKQGIFGKSHTNLLKIKSYSFMDIIKVLVGTAIVLISSNSIVTKTLYFSQIFNIAPFYISLFVLSFGTNLPELTIAIRSIISGKKDIAFGDYLGSASANTLLFGIFTLMIKDPVIQVDNFKLMFLIVSLGLGTFYLFSKSKRAISPMEGLVLLAIYLAFFAIELSPYLGI